MIMQRAALAVFLLAFSFAPAPARAALDQAGADKLKSVFQSWLDYQKSAQDVAGGSALVYDGALSVENAGTYYAVTLPHITAKNPDGSQVKIGIISFNAVPEPQPGRWKMTVAIPTPILVVNAAGQTTMTANIGKQQATGIYDEALQTFASLDAHYNDIVIADAQKKPFLKLAEASSVSNFEKSADGLWLGSGVASARGIDSSFTSQSREGLLSNVLKLKELRADFFFDRYNPAEMAKYKAGILALNRTSTAQTQPPADTLEKLTMDMLAKTIGGIRADYRMVGFDIASTDEAGTPKSALNLASAKVGFDISGLADPKGSIGLRFGVGGMKAAPTPPGYESFMPQDVGLELTGRSIPFVEIGMMVQNMAGEAVQSAIQGGPGILPIMLGMPALLAQAGTTVTLKDGHVGGPDYRFDMNLTAKPDLTAARMATAQGSASFAGLEGLIGKVQNAQTNVAADPVATSNLAQLLQNLLMLKDKGKPAAPGPDGKPVYTYEVSLDPQGRVMVNGAEMGMNGEGTTAAPAP